MNTKTTQALQDIIQWIDKFPTMDIPEILLTSARQALAPHNPDPNDNRLVTIAGLCANDSDYGEEKGEVWHLITLNKDAIKRIVELQALVNLEWLTSVTAPFTDITAYHAPTLEILLADIQLLSDNVTLESSESCYWDICKGTATPIALRQETLTCHVSVSTVRWEFQTTDHLTTCKTFELQINELKKYLPPTQGMN